MKRETEKSFMAAVIGFARIHGWDVFHTHDARRCTPGFPDLVCLRSGRLVFAELKVGKNKLTAEQAQWLRLLATVPGIGVYEWRPDAWPEIERVLGSGV